MYKVYYVCAVLCVCTLCAKCMCGAGIYNYVYLQVYMYMCICVKEYRILYVCAGVCAVCRYHTMLQEQKMGHLMKLTYIACAYTFVHSTFYDSTNAKTK